MTRAFREIGLDTSQGRLAGLHWPARIDNAPRVLCLHGWLDNAASFIPLASLLEELECVAIDLPGHGHSEHRHASTRYHFIDYVWNVDAALDALGWEDCHLLGHSMGAAIASVYSAGAPERVRSVILLDTLGPISSTAQGTADRLRRSLVKNRRGPGKVREFETIDEMVEARSKVSGLSDEAARLICERAAIEKNGTFRWRSDPALNWISSLIMTDDQALDLLAHIESPVLSLTALHDSPWASAEKNEARKKVMAQGRHLSVEGRHHFHMEQPEDIAGLLREFIMDHDRPRGKDTNERAE
jgi:pimeloyl-ACP methyl ester carboxylesterase